THCRWTGLCIDVTSERRMFLDFNWTTGLQINLFSPVYGDKLIGAEQSAVLAVKHISKAVTIEVDQSIMLLAVHHQVVHQDVFIHTIIIPLVKWSFLVCPNHFTCVDLAGHDGHGPLVVPL